MPKQKQEETKSFKENELALQGIAYVEAKNKIKSLENDLSELRKPLEEALIEVADSATLPNGSRLLIMNHADIDVHIKHTLRVSKVLNEDAMELLTKNGLGCCIESKSVIREDIIEAMYEEGRISDELLKKLYSVKENYAFSVTTKKHSDEEL